MVQINHQEKQHKGGTYKIEFLIAALNNLDSLADDIGNAYNFFFLN